MSGAPKTAELERTRIMLGLLGSVERGGGQSQRRLSSELGIALGLVNAYLKRCINKGLVKVSEAPPRRYMYYLTPRGFAEKSRLTVEYLSYSLSLFRQAKTDCAVVFDAARARGVTRIVIAGASDLAEIAVICALDRGVTIVAVVDPHVEAERFAGVPVARSYDEVTDPFDAALVTDIKATSQATQAAVKRLGTDRVLIPMLLGSHPTTDDRGAP